MKKSLGLVLQELNIHREKLFLISKVDNDNQCYEQTAKSFNESLNNLQTDYLESPELQKIADKYECSIAQLLFRWNVQQNIIPIPKSKNKERIKSNINVFSFSICGEDMDILNHMNKNLRISYDPSVFDF